MKKLQFIKYAFYMMVLGLIFTSCEEDPLGGGGGIFENAPSAGLLMDPGFLSTNSTIEPGQIINIRYSAVEGDAAMESVVIRENGSNVDFSRITINGSPANSNPILLFDTETSSFTWDIAIEPHTSGTSQYSIIVSDLNGNAQTSSIDIALNEVFVAPTITGTTSGMVTIAANMLISVPIQATAGSSPLEFVAVTFNDEIITDVSRLTYGGQQFVENPQLLPVSDRDVLESVVEIRVGEEDGLYQIFVVDENQEVSSVDINVVIERGTPVDLDQGILWNSSGPAGFGGLDLDTGAGTGSNDADAEIRDAGSDFGLATEINWLQQIGGTQGSIMKELRAGMNGLSETFSFEDVSSKEEVQELFGAGIDFTLTDANGNPVSRPVTVGSTFVVENSGRFYLIIIREINIAPADNSDNYVIDIKR